ncbi:MAG: right-handed parallel beta-helix repeat-containing protein [Opitutaceae bacterium]|nr:right-handed parallel beta-helix repeat-containing protein [Opitutaceae bacterium]
MTSPLSVAQASVPAKSDSATEFDVRSFGAKGDGLALDSPAINAAIEAAALAGGGTVRVPAGTYRCFSIHLRSHLTLRLEPGATLLAATPADGFGAYDPPEPNEWGDLHQYQDFGHSHWHNSLLWGENLENVSIVGPGLIDGTRGLVRHASYASTGPNGTVAAGIATGAPPLEVLGLGNKAIALKNCRSVTLRDFALLNGGHFAVLASGVDHLAIHHLRIDTNRDGLDIDGCRHVRITDCSINTPNDDAIVLKTSYALGALRPCENITITGCTVSGYDIGSLLDATFRRTVTHAPDRDGPTGRIKIGTESNGDFRAIAVTNCTFDRSRGLALESVDGAVIEDVVISNLVLRDVSNSPIFLRLGNRARGPQGTPVGAIRRVKISHVTASATDGRFPILLVGLPGHPIEDVTLSDIHIASHGGITMADVAAQADQHVNAFFLREDEPGVTGARAPFAVPERPAAYPEPSMFGLLPASAVYARHVEHLTVRDLRYTFTAPDERPLVVLNDVAHVTLERFRAPAPAGEAYQLNHVRHLETNHCSPTPE